MTLSEYMLELNKKGYVIKCFEVGCSLKIIVEKIPKFSFLPFGRSYSTMVHHYEMKGRSQRDYEQLIMDKIRRLINRKFTEPIDTTMREIKE